MIRIPLARVSNSRNKRLVPEFLSLRNSLRLGWVVRVCDPSAVRVFQNVVRDGATLRTALRFWFNINVSHDGSPCVQLSSRKAKRKHASSPNGPPPHNLEINCSPFSPRIPMVVEVAPRGLISPLSYVVDSIRFFDYTPLPYQRQRPGRTDAISGQPWTIEKKRAGKLSEGSKRISAYPRLYKKPRLERSTETICIPPGGEERRISRPEKDPAFGGLGSSALYTQPDTMHSPDVSVLMRPPGRGGLQWVDYAA
jgi:hypothetical protein